MPELSAILPLDHRIALTEGRALASSAEGTVLTLGYERRLGLEALERLQTLLNVLAPLIQSFGGSVTAVKDDRLVAWFEADSSADALKAAVAVQDLFRSTAGLPSFKIAVASGTVIRRRLGSESRQLFEVMVGAPLFENGDILSLLEPQEIGLSHTVGDQRADLPLPRRLVRTARGARVAVYPPGLLKFPGAPPTTPPLPEVLPDAVRPWLPKVLFDRFLAAPDASFPLESRVAVVWSAAVGTESGIGSDALAGFVDDVLDACDRFHGLLLWIEADERATHLTGTFGFPAADDRDAERGLRALQEMRQKADRWKLSWRAGLSRGRLIAGLPGSLRRRAFVMLGHEPVLARSISEMAPSGTILATPAVVRSAAGHFRFMPAARFPGMGAVEAFDLQSLAGSAQHHRPSRLPKTRTLRGRDSELRQADEWFSLAHQRKGALIFIEGDPGLGKSSLLDALDSRGRENGLLVFRGEADALETSTPYFAWRAMVEEIIARTGRRADHDLWPLLSDVLGQNEPDNEVTSALTGEARAEHTQRLLVSLWREESEFHGRPLLFLLEDAHWFDESSWHLLEALRRDLPQALVIVTTRPAAADNEHLSHQLRTAADTAVWTLDPLAAPDLMAMVMDDLAVQTLPPTLPEFLLARGEGNPFFTRETVLSLIGFGYLRVEDGQARLTERFPGWKDLPFPDTLYGTIAARIDALPVDLQEVLKIASVLGRTFPQEALAGLIRGTGAEHHLASFLRRLQHAGLLAPSSGSGPAQWSFQHALIQTVTYDLFPPSLRREVHRKVARWYEAELGSESTAHAAVMATHWKEGGELEKAVKCLRIAGLHSLKAFANHEAIALLEDALRLDESLPASAFQWSVKGEILLFLGLAHLQATNHPGAVASVEKGLAELGHGFPRHPLAFLFHVLGAVLSRLVRGAVSIRQRARAPHSWEQALCETLISISESYGGANDLMKALYATFIGTRWAERLGLVQEYARGLAYCAVVFDFLGWKSVAEEFVFQAEQSLEGTTVTRQKVLTTLAVTFFHSGRGQLSDAFRDLEILARDATVLGDHRSFRDSVNVQVLLLLFQGRFAEARNWAEDLMRFSRQYGDKSMFAVAQSHVLISCVELGTLSLKDMATQLSRHATEADVELYREYALTAVGYFEACTGDWESATIRADRGITYFASIKTLFFSFYFLVLLPTTIYINAWRATGNSEHYAPKLKAAIRELQRYVKSYPVGRPALLWARGVCAALQGKTRASASLWSKGLQGLRDDGAQAMIGQLHRELAACATVPEPQRRAHGEEAQQFFAKRQAGRALREMQTLLEGWAEPT